MKIYKIDICYLKLNGLNTFDVMYYSIKHDRIIESK